MCRLRCLLPTKKSKKNFIFFCRLLHCSRIFSFSMDAYQKSLELHEKFRGKLAVQSKVPLENRDDLSLAYTPGVAEPCRKIAANPDDVYRYTIKSNTVAVVSDGSAVLGLGNIGAAAGIPVMEGKCLLFKRFADIDAFPICLQTQDSDEIVSIVKNIAPVFGGINLEDIAAPRCFEIEERLKKELDIPVFHDDQHGTAIVVLAGLINAFELAGKKWTEVKIIIAGAGAAGIATAKLLLQYGAKNIILCDRKGALHKKRTDLDGNGAKAEIIELTNPNQEQGSLEEVIKNADVFIGVSGPGLLSPAAVKSMASKPIIFAMANPTPEIMPDVALEAGAFIVGTGRSDFPNQINNVLAFPGIFRGVLDIRATQITEKMKLAAAKSLAEHVKHPIPEKVIPGVFDEGVSDAVAEAIKDAV
jgi:malate dehydrogenase (oxaloacetate-decarboxylating)